MNTAVARYRATVESLATKAAASHRAVAVGAEYDDLVQEGLIHVWQSLERGVCPSAEMIENRMRDWIRHLGAQIGVGREEEVNYDLILPLDDFRLEQSAYQQDVPDAGRKI